jgi:D-sedoheptulose 7-phosphate isomerase
VSQISQVLTQALAQARETFDSLEKLQPGLESAADLIATCLTSEKKMLVCGNGGSAADAADFCTEFACRFQEDRKPFPALNLSQGGSLLTATGNDYGFDEIFARQVSAFGQKGDLLIAISTSGKSANIRRALEEGKSRGLKTIALLGRDGGSCQGIAEIDLIVPGEATARIQEAHKFLLHVLCESVEPQLMASKAKARR